MSRRAPLFVPAVFAVLAAAALFAQFTERVDVSAIEVPVIVHDSTGKVPLDLKPSDFLLTEDGTPQEIIGVAYPVREVAVASPNAPNAPAAAEAAKPKRWQIVIYLVQSLTSSKALQHTIEALVPEAERLTQLGDVEVVGDATPTPQLLVPATGDASALRKALLDLAPKARGLDQVGRLRREYIAALDEQRSAKHEFKKPFGPPAVALGGETVNRGLAAARLEAQMVRFHQETMLAWLARYAAGNRPRAVLIAGTGFDTNPIDFYRGATNSLETDMRALDAGPRQLEVARAMAAQGWTAISFAPNWTDTQQAPMFDAGFIGRDASARDANVPTGIAMHPLQPLEVMAEETGGSVITNAAKLGSEISDLGNRIVLTYQLHGPRNGLTHRIEVKALRPGLTVRAQKSVVAGSPDAVGVARATILARGDGERGELPLRCTIKDTPAGKESMSDLEATVSLTPIDAIRGSLTAATIRFSVAVAPADAPPFTTTKRLENLDLSKESAWRIEVQLKHKPGAGIGVVAEELSTGAWGGGNCVPWAGAQSPTVVADSLAHGRWKPLNEAMIEAQASGKLILADVRNGAVIDKKADAWLEKAEAYDQMQGVLSGMVTAVARVRSTDISAEPRLARKIAEGRHLAVLDPYGTVLFVPDDSYGDLAKFTYNVNALRLQTPTLVRAAALQAEGKKAEALVLRAGGLLDAGAADAAKQTFEEAYVAAKEANDLASMQSASIGVAAVDMQLPYLTPTVIRHLEEVVAHPANNDIAARAWMLLGHAHRGRGEKKAAIDAYQKAFAVAPKPSAIADGARRLLEMLGSEPEGETRAATAAGSVHLLYPHRDVSVGSIDVGVAAPPETERVELYLDDARVDELTRRPFRGSVNLGATPHPHTIRAVAFDARNARIGEESAALNDRASALSVAIVSPRDEQVESRATVEVAPRVPEGKRLAGVDLYWNETKVATLTAAPWRSEITLPSKSAAGYIRAVARADDGATAEDVKMINAGGPVEQMRVDAVQVYAVVQDKQGRYLEGLKSEDFVVKEDGRQVPAQVQSSVDDPITVGLALDTSGSLQTSMLDVIEYANEFVKNSLSNGDQTFVVTFDEQPRLAQPLTANRQLVSATINDVHAGGATAIWDSTLFALQQFRDVPGKRALLLFTDGANNSGVANTKAAIRYAREIGVPVYAVMMYTVGQSIGPLGASPYVPRGTIASSAAPGSAEGELQQLAEQTGGALFRFPRKKDLPQIFKQVRDDTRGEYLLTYVSPSSKPRTEMRKVSVTVPNRGATVRAMSGYYPR